VALVHGPWGFFAHAQFGSSEGFLPNEVGMNGPFLYTFLLYLASRLIKGERKIIFASTISFGLFRRNKSLLKQIHGGKVGHLPPLNKSGYGTTHTRHLIL
jgi:hypothetical protein